MFTDDIDAIVKKWNEIVLSTDPINKDRAMDAVCKMYRRIGLEPPREFVFLDSSEVPEEIIDYLFKEYGHVVIELDRWCNLYKQELQIDLRIEKELDSCPQKMHVINKAASMCKGILFWRTIVLAVTQKSSFCIFMLHATYSINLEEFLLKEIQKLQGKKVCLPFNNPIELYQECGAVYPTEPMAIIVNRPCEIHMENNRLHNANGPAVLYRDGYSVYAWRGQIVPAEWIENKENLQAADILQEEDVELRAVGMEIIGWDKAMEQLNCRVIDDSGDPDIGKLVEMKLPGLVRPGRFLVAECPRNGTIVEGVPYISDIDGKPIETAIAAQAWRIGDPQDEYIHPERRT